MSTAFSRTTRAVYTEPSRRSLIVIVLALGVTVAWAVWFFRSEVTLHESSVARVEALRVPHRVDAPVAGLLAAVRVNLGQTVHRGELVFELDAEADRRRLAEDQALLDALGPQIEASKSTIAAFEQALVDDKSVTTVAVDEEAARHREAEIARTLADSEARRAQQLFDAGAVSEAELARARAEADRRREASRAAELGAHKQNRGQRLRDTQGRARIEDLRRELAALLGRQKEVGAAIESLRHVILQHEIRAPIDGRIAEMTTLTPGSFVAIGERLTTIVPDGELRVVADLSREQAVGRVREGQTAIVRLDAFPWTQYGTLPARVAHVATEPRDGRFRVELAVTPTPTIRPEHGLSGTVEIDVERASPAALVARVVGMRATRPADER